MKTLCLMMVVVAMMGGVARAQDGAWWLLEEEGLRALVGGELGDPPWFEQAGIDREPLARFGLSMADVRAVTGRVEVVAAALERLDSAPSEVSRIAYDTGWSHKKLPDGTDVWWRHRNSPYVKTVDAAQEAEAVATATNKAVDLRTLKRDIATNIMQAGELEAAVSNTVQVVSALPFGAAYKQAEVRALRVQLEVLARQVRDLAREVEDNARCDQRDRRALDQSER